MLFHQLTLSAACNPNTSRTNTKELVTLHYCLYTASRGTALHTELTCMERVRDSSSIVVPLDLRSTGVDSSDPFSDTQGNSLPTSPFSSVSDRSPEPFTRGVGFTLGVVMLADEDDFIVSFSLVFLPKLTAILGRLRREVISGVVSPLPTVVPPSSLSSEIAPSAAASPSAFAS